AADAHVPGGCTHHRDRCRSGRIGATQRLRERSLEIDVARLEARRVRVCDVGREHLAAVGARAQRALVQVEKPIDRIAHHSPCRKPLVSAAAAVNAADVPGWYAATCALRRAISRTKPRHFARGGGKAATARQWL